MEDGAGVAGTAGGPDADGDATRGLLHHEHEGFATAAIITLCLQEKRKAIVTKFLKLKKTLCFSMIDSV